MFSPVERKQVLIYDGDPVFVKSVINILEEHGIDTITASSAQGVVHKASHLDVDMILLGETISDDNGFDVCETLKKSSHTDHIPVMMLSFSCAVEQRLKGYRLGADDCLSKDFQKEELCARMEAIWRRGNGHFQGQREGRQRQVVQELSRIIELGLVEPHFQPIYFLRPFRFFGVEVLSRPSQTAILNNPDELFKAAVKYDMYYPLEMMCWQKAIDVIVNRTRNEHVFFNCGPYIVENAKFVQVKKIFEYSRIPLDKVVLEITERSSIVNHDLFYNRLNEYREQGFSFAIDDVGGGYASLESIVATKPEIVKIDAHIIRSLHQDQVKRSIVKFIVAFCKENQIVSVAEGVETREELEAVTQMGVDAVQGYYLFRPTADLNLHQMKDISVNFS